METGTWNTARHIPTGKMVKVVGTWKHRHENRRDDSGWYSVWHRVIDVEMPGFAGTVQVRESDLNWQVK